jgi:hypothetical protein
MNKKCPVCHLVTFPAALTCGRCGAGLIDSSEFPKVGTNRGYRFIKRGLICGVVCIAVLLGFYLSLIASAKSLTIDQKSTVRSAINLLKEKGFSDEAFLLENLTAYRSNDNWLNASVVKENAYAATNFPFEIMTLYPEFFTYPMDDTERAAVLLHEAKHLAGQDEHDAYEFVWNHRKQLGWTKEKYAGSHVWQNVRKQTRDNAPALFICEFNEFSDCTE